MGLKKIVRFQVDNRGLGSTVMAVNLEGRRDESASYASPHHHYLTALTWHAGPYLMPPLLGLESNQLGDPLDLRYQCSAA